MFRIGEFSRIARVSCRLLRYYDEIGLLDPAHVEPGSGYRYYSAMQLPRLNRILVLKELGLSLDQIARVLEERVSAEELRGMLLMRRAAIERALADESARLRHIEARIAQIEAEGRLSADDVILRPEPARSLLSRRQVIPSFSAARDVIAEICDAVRGRMAAETLGPLVAVAHAQEFEPDHLDVEIGFVLRDDARADVPPDLFGLHVRELPSVARMAVCVRVGPPEQAHLVTTKIGRFVEANGYRLAGPSREVFLHLPPLDRMQESLVEMQFPVEERPEASRS